MINIPFADAEPKSVPVNRDHTDACIKRIIGEVKRSGDALLIEIEPNLNVAYYPSTDKWVDPRKDSKGRVTMGRGIRSMLRHIGVQKWIEAYELDEYATKHAPPVDNTPVLTDIHDDTLRFTFNGRVQEWRVRTNLSEVMLRRVFNRYFTMKPGGSLKIKRLCKYAEGLDASIICSQIAFDEVPS